MKGPTIVALIVIGALLGAGLGARLHARILSFRDGLSKVDLEKATAPAGFEVSPQTANFIFSSLLHNAWHWGADGAIDAYVDADSYYILGVIPRGQSFCSYTARVLGTRISGKDGRIFNNITGEWENKGYVHRRRSEIMSIVTNGISDFDLDDLIGIPFSTDIRGIRDETGDMIDQLHYWSRDGEILIFMKHQQVIGISTNIDFMRI